MVEATVDAATAALDGVDVDLLADGEVGRLVAICERAVRRLGAREARLVATLADRARAAAVAARPEDARAGERAERHLRRQIATDLGLTPQDAKRAIETGRQLEQRPQLGAAAQKGQLSVRHAAILEQVLRRTSADLRLPLEAELVPLAATQDPVTFARSCRRRLAATDAEAFEADWRARMTRRSGREWTDDDGMAHLHVALTGMDAEWVTTAVRAFRRRDAAGEHRRPEQATADAVVAMARAALASRKDPDARGALPIVQVIFNTDADTSTWQVGEALASGPLPVAELERLLGNAQVAGVLGSATRAPTSVTSHVRTVPRGLWDLLIVRDGGCIWPGCDAPAAWCQVMHLATPFRLGGRLGLETAGLGCATHHRLYDSGPYTYELVDGRPVIVRTDGLPMPRRIGSDVGGAGGANAGPDPP